MTSGDTKTAVPIRVERTVGGTFRRRAFTQMRESKPRGLCASCLGTALLDVCTADRLVVHHLHRGIDRVATGSRGG
jgi:hypothetical protein